MYETAVYVEHIKKGTKTGIDTGTDTEKSKKTSSCRRSVSPISIFDF
jgi:hypothetical protein